MFVEFFLDNIASPYPARKRTGLTKSCPSGTVPRGQNYHFPRVAVASAPLTSRLLSVCALRRTLPTLLHAELHGWRALQGSEDFDVGIYEVEAGS